MESIGRRMVDIAEHTVSSITAEEAHDRVKAGEAIVITPRLPLVPTGTNAVDTDREVNLCCAF